MDNKKTTRCCGNEVYFIITTRIYFTNFCMSCFACFVLKIRISELNYRKYFFAFKKAKNGTARDFDSVFTYVSGENCALRGELAAFVNNPAFKLLDSLFSCWHEKAGFLSIGKTALKNFSQTL